MTLNHLTLIVKNLERSSQILIKVLQARMLYRTTSRKHSLYHEIYFDVQGTTMVLMEGEEEIPRTYNHIAFSVEESAMDDHLVEIKKLGLEFRESRHREVWEGRSIYFYDDDRHLFELHSGDLMKRLAHYRSLDGG